LNHRPEFSACVEFLGLLWLFLWADVPFLGTPKRPMFCSQLAWQVQRFRSLRLAGMRSFLLAPRPAQRRLHHVRRIPLGTHFNGAGACCETAVEPTSTLASWKSGSQHTLKRTENSFA
jgi:hypothetical protein